MPTWIAAGNGTWTDPANWLGGVPAAAGSTASFSFATNVGGSVIVGIPEFEKWKFDADRTRRKEISIEFIRRQVDCVQPSLDMMASGEINIDRMITHRFPFTETKAAFDLVAGYHDGVMKTMIDFE